MAKDQSKLTFPRFAVILLIASGAFASICLVYSVWQERQASRLAQQEISLARRFISHLSENPQACLELATGRSSQAYDFSKGAVGLPESAPVVYLRTLRFEMMDHQKARFVMEFESEWLSPRRSVHYIPLALINDHGGQGMAACTLAADTSACSLHDDLCSEDGRPVCTEISANGLNCPPLPESSCRPFFYAAISETSGREECNCAWRCQSRKKLLRGRRDS